MFSFESSIKVAGQEKLNAGLQSSFMLSIRRVKTFNGNHGKTLSI